MDVFTHAVGENTRAMVFNHLKNSRFNLLYRFFWGMMIYYCDQYSGRM